MTGSNELPRPSAAPVRKKGFPLKIASVALWLGSAVAVGFCWGVVETLIVRNVFTSGEYFNRDVFYAVNGRVVFYGLTAAFLSALLTPAIELWGRIIKRPITLRAAAKRALVGTAVAAAYVNLTLCLMYFWQEVATSVGNEVWKLGLLGALPAALITAAVVFTISRIRRRYAALRRIFSCVSYAALIVGAAVGTASLVYRQYRLLARPDPESLPDVVVVTLDAWRADTLREDITPQIIAYAQQNGIIFTEGRAASSWTLPSFTATLTGSYNITDKRAMEPTASKRPTWAEVMRNGGYDTYAIISNRHLELVRRLWRGFDHFDYIDFHSPWDEIGFYDTALYFAKRGRLMEAEVPGETTRRLAGRTLDIFRRPSRRPKFIWVHVLDPHFPYQPLKDVLEIDAPEFLDKKRFGINRALLKRKNAGIFKDLYEYELKSTDLLLADLLRELATRPNTLVVISSDHGEEFFEHGSTRHGKTLYDEVCRVPLIIALPEGSRKSLSARESAVPVSLVDVAPSVLSYLGLEVPASMDGRRDLLTAGGDIRDEDVYGTLNQLGDFQAILIRGRRKLYVRIKGEEIEVEYYDLDADPGERHSLPLDARGEEMKNRLLEWIARKGIPGGVSAETPSLFGGREELRALGYM